MGAPHVTSSRGGGRRPQLPAFCRTRRPTTVAVTDSSLTALRLMVFLVLLFQLSTLLLLAGPVPPLPAASTNTLLRSDPGTDAGGGQPGTPLSDR